MKLDGDRALADIFGGSSGGWPFWLAALAGLELALRRSRERESAFTSYPTGEFGRFLRDVDEALALAVLGAGVQDAVNGELKEGATAERHALIASVLTERAREAARARARLRP